MPSKKPSRLRLALLNVWNLAALVAAGGLAIAMKSPLPIVAAGVMEGGWLAFATRPRASRALFAAAHAVSDAAIGAGERADKLRACSEEDRQRVARLELRAEEIRRMAAQNRHLAPHVIAAEVSRLADVVGEFVDLAVSMRSWRAVLEAQTDADLDSELAHQEAAAARTLDDETRALARRQQALCMEQREQRDEMRKKLAHGSDQLELIESTFKIIANEIALLGDRDHLRAQLDDLVVGVRSVRESAGIDRSADDDPAKKAAAALAQATARRI